MSRGNLGDATMTFSGDDGAFQQAAARVERGMRQTAAVMQQQAGVIDSALKGSGEEVVKFALKISYISYAGQAFRSVGKAVDEFTTKIKLGQASMQDLIDKAIGGIPVIGHFWEAGRDIRKAIDGDDAAVAKSDADVKAANEKIELQKRLADAIRSVTRQAQDANQALNFDITKSPLFNSAKTILKTGERTAEDQKKQRADTEKLIADVAAKKTLLGQQLQDLIRDRPEFISTPTGTAPIRDDAGQKLIAEKRLEIDNLEKKAADLRGTLASLNDLLNDKGGRPTFTALANLVGGEVVKAFDAAGAAVARFVGRNREASAETSKLIASFNAIAQARAGNIGQFQTETNSLGIDLSRGVIGKDLFQKLSDKSFFDQAARSVGSILQQYAPIAETIARLADSGLLGPIRATGVFNANLSGLLPGSVDQTPKRFQSTTVGLTDLNRRIQEAALSGPAAKDPVQEGILKAAEATSSSQAEATRILTKILNKNTAAVVK